MPLPSSNTFICSRMSEATLILQKMDFLVNPQKRNFGGLVSGSSDRLESCCVVIRSSISVDGAFGMVYNSSNH